MIAGSESLIEAGPARSTPSSEQTFPGEDAVSPEGRSHSADQPTRRRYPPPDPAYESTLAVWLAGHHRGANENPEMKQPLETPEQPGHPTCEESMSGEPYSGVILYPNPAAACSSENPSLYVRETTFFNPDIFVNDALENNNCIIGIRFYDIINCDILL